MKFVYVVAPPGVKKHDFCKRLAVEKKWMYIHVGKVLMDYMHAEKKWYKRMRKFHFENQNIPSEMVRYILEGELGGTNGRGGITVMLDGFPKNLDQIRDFKIMRHLGRQPPWQIVEEETSVEPITPEMVLHFSCEDYKTAKKQFLEARGGSDAPEISFEERDWWARDDSEGLHEAFAHRSNEYHHEYDGWYPGMKEKLDGDKVKIVEIDGVVDYDGQSVQKVMDEIEAWEAAKKVKDAEPVHQSV